MLVLRGELPEALETCDTLHDSWEQRSCYGGVFMQNVMAPDGSPLPAPEDPLYPCAELADRHRAMCYQKQTGYAVFARNDGDFPAVFALCAAGRRARSARRATRAWGPAWPSTSSSRSASTATRGG